MAAPAVAPHPPGAPLAAAWPPAAPGQAAALPVQASAATSQFPTGTLRSTTLAAAPVTFGTGAPSGAQQLLLARPAASQPTAQPGLARSPQAQGQLQQVLPQHLRAQAAPVQQQLQQHQQQVAMQQQVVQQTVVAQQQPGRMPAQQVAGSVTIAPDGSAQSARSAAAAGAHKPPPPVPAQRLPKPHDYFPFDVFSGRAHEGLLPQALQDELSYVRDHCMVPPYPWGQVIYHDFLVNHVLKEVPGDLAEFGIGQGGTSLFFARLAKQYGRKFLAVDSFAGLPDPDTGKDNPYFLPGDYRPNGGTDNYERFLRYKERFDVDDNLHVIKGFFSEAEIPDEFEAFAFVHMDSDLYDSVYDSLTKVWDRLSVGGCIAVDDFFHHAQGPARAVSDFFRSLGPDVEPPLMFVVPTYAVLIVKGQSACLRREDAQGGVRPVMHSNRALDGNFYSFALMRKCQPFVRAVQASVKNAQQALEEAAARGEATGAYARVAGNAEAFLNFLLYPGDGARSGLDIMRYLLPLEDLFDIAEGNLCGMPGVGRRTIEIGI